MLNGFNTSGASPYTYTLDDQGRVISSTGMDMMTGENVTYTWSYDANAEPHAFQFHVRYAEDFLVLLLFVLVGVPEDPSPVWQPLCLYHDGNKEKRQITRISEQVPI